MKEVTFSRHRPFVLLAGTILLIAGCSAEPIPPNKPVQPEQAKVAATKPSPVSVSSEQNSSTSSKTLADPRLAVDGEGLRWFLQPSGSARPVPFGTPQAEVLIALEAARGPARKGVNQDCGAGPVQYAIWPDGLSLVFKDGRLVGWGLDQRASNAITTAAGIGPGSTRAELEAAYNATVAPTSLGTEFSAGDLHGILESTSAQAKITDMWAGVSCAAR